MDQIIALINKTPQKDTIIQEIAYNLPKNYELFTKHEKKLKQEFITVAELVGESSSMQQILKAISPNFTKL